MNDGWQRLSPLSPLVNLGRGGFALVLIAVPELFARGSGWTPFTFYVPLLAIGLVSGAIAWLVTRWRVQDTVLEKEQGLIRRQSLRFPLMQVQAIDVIRPGLARVFGLAELRLRMGGSSGTTGRLAYLRVEEALELRERLLELGRRGEETSYAPRPEGRGEHVIVTTPTPRLLASLLLSNGSVLLIAALAISIVYVGSGLTGGYLVVMAANIMRRFNGSYHLTVSEADDGLRLHGGLVTTTAETIPRGRVQAVKLVEPFLWRRLGWCRLQVDLAGRQRSAEEAAPEARRVRTLLPVGRRNQVDELLARLLPDVPTDRSPPPLRARLKSPFRYRFLSWGRTDACVVTTTGRLTRVTSWVPLAKVQSLRLVRGPVQRSLRLTTLHLDTAGRGVRAALRDRDVEEAVRVLDQLVDLARSARRSASISSA